MKLRFLQDFQGRETRERFYTKGHITEDFDNEEAAVLIRDNRAELVEDAPVIVVEVEQSEPKKKVKK